MIPGVDLASYQGAPDFDKVSKEYAFGFTKVTEGETYTFPGFRRNRSELRSRSMGVGLYHFARGGDPTAEANYFLGAVGNIELGECLALDWEINGTDPVGWCNTFLCRCYVRTGIRPYIYLNASTVGKFKWGDIAAAGFPLWLAKYDGVKDFPGVPFWGTPLIKQYASDGRVPGINGSVDLDVFNGDLALFHRMGWNPATATAPATGPETLPELHYGDTGPKVESLQKFLNAYAWKPALKVLPTTGKYLDLTAAVLADAQRQMGIVNGDGRNVGPQTKSGLWDRGWRG
jgi:lysozyme